MSNLPLLSIVTPTRGKFSELWLEHLYAISGEVEFILVYYPNVSHRAIADSRFTQITCPYKGEVIQRLTGLLNAKGRYVIALDDDDFIHPQVVTLVQSYFQKFPDSWVLRLSMTKIPHTDLDKIKSPWQPNPDLDNLKVARRTEAGEEYQVLQEVPIAPLNNKFNWRFLIDPYLKRQDLHGAHIENFNNKVWKAELVQDAIADLAQVTRIYGALTWIPFWSLDRLLGLFIQAKFYQENIIIGHWMPKPEQIRYIVMSQSLKKEFRLIFPADVLLAKRFPQYGYFWNVTFEQGWIAVKRLAQEALKFSRD
ncbi:MAG: glycosyltransferase [Spirulinaceae cyanobacterium]